MAFAKLKTMHTAAGFEGGKKKPEWLALLKEHGLSSSKVFVNRNPYVNTARSLEAPYHAERRINKDIVRILVHNTGGYRAIGTAYDEYCAVVPEKLRTANKYVVVDIKLPDDGDVKILGFAFGSCVAMSEAFFSATVPQLKAARKLLA